MADNDRGQSLITKYVWVIEAVEDSKGNEQIVNCTQYEGWHVESSGLIKFDFLGLKTLSQMRDICASVKVHYDKDFDIEKIPIDDEKSKHSVKYRS